MNRTTLPCAHCQTLMTIVLGWWACPDTQCNHTARASADELYRHAKALGVELVYLADRSPDALDRRRVAEIKLNLSEIARTLSKMPGITGREKSYSVNGILQGWFDHYHISNNRDAVQTQTHRALSARQNPPDEASRWYWRIMLPALRQKLATQNFYTHRNEVAHAV